MKPSAQGRRSGLAEGSEAFMSWRWSTGHAGISAGDLGQLAGHTLFDSRSQRGAGPTPQEEVLEPSPRPHPSILYRVMLPHGEKN